MWPKILDMTRDECRGVLRRLELESYSSVVGTFRAQGTLNEAKVKILKDLREAFHISDDRHKAEVRRVVNDEAYSTIAKAIYGPNSEIEWNKEGARGFSILARTAPQTALSVVADRAAKLGDELNSGLLRPICTNRDRLLFPSDENVENSHQIVTSDPLQMKLQSQSTPIKLESLNTKQTESNSNPPAKKRGLAKTSLSNAQANLRIHQLYNTNNKSMPLARKLNATPSTKRNATNNRRRKSQIIVKDVINQNESIDHNGDTTNENGEISTKSTDLSQEQAGVVQLLQSNKNAYGIELQTTHHPIEFQPDVHRHTPSTPPNNTQYEKRIQAPINYIMSPSKDVTAGPKVNSTIKTNPRIVKFFDSNSVVMRTSPKVVGSTATSPTTSNVILKKPTQINISSPLSTNQTSSIITASSSSARIPPKISILSQQTITKSNINFLPLSDNKIIIKSDSKLANALRTNKVQMIPSTFKSNNLIIRGSNQVKLTTQSSTSTPSPSSSSTSSRLSTPSINNKMHAVAVAAPAANNDEKTVYVVKNTITMHPNQYDENILIDNTPVDIISGDAVDYIIEETGTYEMTDENDFSNNVAYLSTTGKSDSVTPTKISKIVNKFNRIPFNDTNTYKYSNSIINKNPNRNPAVSKLGNPSVVNDVSQAIVYEEQDEPVTDWEYELDQSNNIDGNTITIDNDGNEYHEHDSNVIYTEIIDDGNVTEEYVTTEVFSPNDNVIEMEIDSVNQDSCQVVSTEEGYNY